MLIVHKNRPFLQHASYMLDTNSTDLNAIMPVCCNVHSARPPSCCNIIVFDFHLYPETGNIYIHCTCIVWYMLLKLTNGFDDDYMAMTAAATTTVIVYHHHSLSSSPSLCWRQKNASGYGAHGENGGGNGGGRLWSRGTYNTFPSQSKAYNLPIACLYQYMRY